MKICYRSYADHLASWGYAVLQYDTPVLKIIPDTVEVAPWTRSTNSTHQQKLLEGQQYCSFVMVQIECLGRILGTWLEEKIADPECELHGRIDTERMVIAGHSRGGKLAALQYAGDLLPPPSPILLPHQNPDPARLLPFQGQITNKCSKAT
jgi:predicted dienelactone hydrolase